MCTAPGGRLASRVACRPTGSARATSRQQTRWPIHAGACEETLFAPRYGTDRSSSNLAVGIGARRAQPAELHVDRHRLRGLQPKLLHDSRLGLVVDASLGCVHGQPDSRHIALGQRERKLAADAHRLCVTDHELLELGDEGGADAVFAEAQACLVLAEQRRSRPELLDRGGKRGACEQPHVPRADAKELPRRGVAEAAAERVRLVDDHPMDGPARSGRPVERTLPAGRGAQQHICAGDGIHPRLARAVDVGDLELRRELLELVHPLAEERDGREDERHAPRARRQLLDRRSLVVRLVHRLAALGSRRLVAAGEWVCEDQRD